MGHPRHWNCVCIFIPHQVKTQRGKNTTEKASPKFSLLDFLFVLLTVGLNIDFSALKNWRLSIFFCHVLNMLKMKKTLHYHIFPLQKCEQLAQQVLSSICIIYCKMYIISLADSKSTNTSINPFMNPYVTLDVDELLLQEDVMLNNWCRCTVANSMPFSFKRNQTEKKFFTSSLFIEVGVFLYTHCWSSWVY